MNFSEPRLVSIYGSWMRVQVAFYDFLFKSAMNLCAKHWNELAFEEAMTTLKEEFNDGGDMYERSIKAIMNLYQKPDDAWHAFLETT